MGRELQKKKNRSGNPKVRQRSSKKPNGKAVILNNALIAANWDKKQTLAQNYARLGLARKLNGSTGGVERGGVSKGVDVLDIRRVKRGREGDVGDKAFEKGVGVGEVRILRDAEGRIVRVLDDDNGAGGAGVGGKKRHWAGELNDPLRALEESEEYSSSDDDEMDDQKEEEEEEFTSFSDDDEEKKEDRDGHLQHISSHLGTKAATKANEESQQYSIIPQLVASASIPGAKKPRKQSEREAEWCQTLVEKHGRDYGAMARDAKLNVMQQSVGDLRRRVEKYLKTVNVK